MELLRMHALEAATQEVLQVVHLRPSAVSQAAAGEPLQEQHLQHAGCAQVRALQLGDSKVERVSSQHKAHLLDHHSAWVR